MFYWVDYTLRLADVRDGTSNTFMIGEDVGAATEWCSWPYANNATSTCAIPLNVERADGGDYPAWNWQNNKSFRSRHACGLFFACDDGSVHFIENGFSLPVYRALATIQGGEVAALP